MANQRSILMLVVFPCLFVVGCSVPMSHPRKSVNPAPSSFEEKLRSGKYLCDCGKKKYGSWRSNPGGQYVCSDCAHAINRLNAEGRWREASSFLTLKRRERNRRDAERTMLEMGTTKTTVSHDLFFLHNGKAIGPFYRVGFIRNNLEKTTLERVVQYKSADGDYLEFQDGEVIGPFNENEWQSHLAAKQNYEIYKYCGKHEMIHEILREAGERKHRRGGTP